MLQQCKIYFINEVIISSVLCIHQKASHTLINALLPIPDNIKHGIKNNSTTIKKYDTIWIYKYIKIVWIKENICQNLYNTLNTI